MNNAATIARNLELIDTIVNARPMGRGIAVECTSIRAAKRVVKGLTLDGCEVRHTAGRMLAVFLPTS